MAVNMESLVARLEAVAARLEAQAGAPAPAKGTATQSAASPGTVHPSVAAFDEILTGPLKALTTAAGTLNEPEIADATTLFADAFNAERRMSSSASRRARNQRWTPCNNCSSPSVNS